MLNLRLYSLIQKIFTDCLLYTRHNVTSIGREKNTKQLTLNSQPCEGNTSSYFIVINAMIMLSTDDRGTSNRGI